MISAIVLGRSVTDRHIVVDDAGKVGAVEGVLRAEGRVNFVCRLSTADDDDGSADDKD